MPSPRNGLSVASLVLGVISIVPCSIFAGIPAIITGHMALNRANKAPNEYGAKGLAKAGLILGYLSLVLGLMILPAMVLPALAKGKASAQQAQCRNQLRSISAIARTYANQHQEKLPADFLSMSNDMASPKFLVCPADKQAKKSTNWTTFGSANTSYEFLLGGADLSKVPAEAPMILCRRHGLAAHVDGSVHHEDLEDR